MSAVNYLYSNGVCHRDVNMNCVLVSQYGYHWLLKMGNFNYAVYRSGPVTATSFIYGYQELRWLGGTDSCLPPEILNTPENAQSLDYSGTDSFAIGCLIYDMYGLDNPFEKDPQLVFTQYKTASLPLLPASMVPLQRLLRLLLCWDPCHRLSPSTALLLCQALLWLPEPWLKSPPSDLLLRQQLDYDCVSLVAAIATMDLRPVPLPHVLHANFLNSCNVSELVRALFVFQSYIE